MRRHFTKRLPFAFAGGCGWIARRENDCDAKRANGNGEAPRDLVILDQQGQPLKAGDHDRRFFEASWMHKHNGKYYFSYSTGDTHLLCYATSDTLYGPYTYQGVILTPVVGWTTHHSICEFKGKWYLFYHDSKPSGGRTWLRSLKVVELEYLPDGSIKTITGQP